MEEVLVKPGEPLTGIDDIDIVEIRYTVEYDIYVTVPREAQAVVA